MRTLLLVAAGAIFSGFLLSIACSTASSSADGLRPAQRHAIHSDRLRRVMTGLGERAQKTWPQEIDHERRSDAGLEREGRFEEAQELAAALADAAGLIPEAIEGVELSADERGAFLSEVGRLRAQAGQLQATVAARDVDQMHAVLRSIRTTCNQCHSQFREIAGSVDARPHAPDPRALAALTATPL